MTNNDYMKLAVIGWPISHSLSPRLHQYWLKAYSIPANYIPLGIEPDLLETTIRGLHTQDFTGVNVTLPYKEQVMDYLDEIDDTAKRIGAVNTICVREDGKLWGTNTDAYGFMQNIKGATSRQQITKKALVIGAGGASRAICVGLLDEEYEVALVNRTKEKAEAIAKSLNHPKLTIAGWGDIPEKMKQCSLLVNATSLGMQGQEPLVLNLIPLSRAAVVNDIVYRPLNTPLLKKAQAHGNTVVDGLGMLLYQGQKSFEHWFGMAPEVTPSLRSHVLEGIA